jgi:transcriptional regulator with XRE-family HTH domain
MSVFCKRLKDARKAAGISQERLGLLAGIEPASASARMNQYETGKHAPNTSTVSLIAGVLNVPPSYFYSEDDDEARLLVLFHRMDSAERMQILDWAAGQLDSR